MESYIIFISPNILPLRFTHVIACDAVSFFFFFKAAQYSILCACHISFIQSSVDGHLGSFCLMAVANRAAVNVVGMQISLHDGVGGMQQYFFYSVWRTDSCALSWGHWTCLKQGLFWGVFGWTMGSLIQGADKRIPYLCVESSLFQTASAKNILEKELVSLAYAGQGQKTSQMWAPEEQEGRTKPNSVNLSWAALTHTKEGQGQDSKGLFGLTWRAVAFYYWFSKVALWCGSPSEWMGVKWSPLGYGVYKWHIFLCECYFRKSAGVCFLAESFTAVFVVRCV